MKNSLTFICSERQTDRHKHTQTHTYTNTETKKQGGGTASFFGATDTPFPTRKRGRSCTPALPPQTQKKGPQWPTSPITEKLIFNSKLTPLNVKKSLTKQRRKRQITLLDDLPGGWNKKIQNTGGQNPQISELCYVDRFL